MTLLDETRTAEAIEHALAASLLDARAELPSADVVAAIAAAARDAQIARDGLGAAFADDYWRDPDAFCRRMERALSLAAHIHHAEDQYPALTGQAAAHENGELR